MKYLRCPRRRTRTPLHPIQGPKPPNRDPLQAPASPEFLFQEEAILQRRSWKKNVTYYTGCGYLVRSVTGVGKGFLEGLKALEKGDTMKLRSNRILNAFGHTGWTLGNRLGVIGLLYAGLEGGIVAYKDTNDVINIVVVGLGIAVLFKAASAAVAGTSGGLMVGVVVDRKQVVKRYVPI